MSTNKALKIELITWFVPISQFGSDNGFSFDLTDRFSS